MSIYVYIYIHTFSHNHGSVENGCIWKVTTVLLEETVFHFHDYRRKGKYINMLYQSSKRTPTYPWSIPHESPFTPKWKESRTINSWLGVWGMFQGYVGKFLEVCIKVPGYPATWWNPRCFSDMSTWSAHVVSYKGSIRHETLTSWWFQPIWKILVKLVIFPK